MKRFLFFAALLAAVLVGIPQNARADAGSKANTFIAGITHNDGTAFSAETMVAGAAITSVFNVTGIRFITFYTDVDMTSSVAVTQTCNFGTTALDMDYVAQSRSILAGVATYTDYSVVKTTDDAKYPIRWEVHGYNFMQCTWSAANGTVDFEAWGGVQ